MFRKVPDNHRIVIQQEVHQSGGVLNPQAYSRQYIRDYKRLARQFEALQGLAVWGEGTLPRAHFLSQEVWGYKRKKYSKKKNLTCCTFF